MIERLARALRESTTYQAILHEGEARGRADEARRLLLRTGSKKFGPPSSDTMAVLAAITDVERIEQLAERVIDAASWADVLRDA